MSTKMGLLRDIPVALMRANAFPNREEIARMSDDDRSSDIERDIREAIGPGAAGTPATAADVGRLSAEAIKAQYEAGAVAMQQMATDLLESLKHTEADTLEVVRMQDELRKRTEDAVEQCRICAASYLTEAADQAKRIEAASQLAERVRKTCEDLSTSILGGGVDGTKTGS
jgi:hypothetical protein